MPPGVLRGARLSLALVMLGAACTPRYVRVADGIPLGADPRQRVQVFARGRTLELHAIAMNPEAVSGVPYFQSPSCASCRITVPRPEIDSLRVINPKDDTPLYVGLGIVAVLFLMFTACQPGGCVPGR